MQSFLNFFTQLKYFSHVASYIRCLLQNSYAKNYPALSFTAAQTLDLFPFLWFFFHPVLPDLHRGRDLITLFFPFPPRNCRCVSEFRDPCLAQPPSFIIYLPFDVPLREKAVFLGHTAVSDALIRFAIGFAGLTNIRNCLCDKYTWGKELVFVLFFVQMN